MEKIKKHCKELYLDLTSDECNHLCYYYSLVLGLILKDVNLIWGGIYCPIKHCWFAHAFIEKNGYVYDSNFRLSYKFEDYAKAQNLKIYIIKISIYQISVLVLGKILLNGVKKTISQNIAVFE